METQLVWNGDRLVWNGDLSGMEWRPVGMEWRPTLLSVTASQRACIHSDNSSSEDVASTSMGPSLPKTWESALHHYDITEHYITMTSLTMTHSLRRNMVYSPQLIWYNRHISCSKITIFKSPRLATGGSHSYLKWYVLLATLSVCARKQTIECNCVVPWIRLEQTE